MTDLEKAQAEYIRLLEKCIDETATFLDIHGMGVEPSVALRAEVLREAIKKAGG